MKAENICLSCSYRGPEQELPSLQIFISHIRGRTDWNQKNFSLDGEETWLASCFFQLNRKTDNIWGFSMPLDFCELESYDS